MQRLGRAGESYPMARASNGPGKCSYPHTAVGRARPLPAISGLALVLGLFLTLEAEDVPGCGGDGQPGLAIPADGNALVVAVVDNFEGAAADGAVRAGVEGVFPRGARRQHPRDSKNLARRLASEIRHKLSYINGLACEEKDSSPLGRAQRAKAGCLRPSDAPNKMAREAGHLFGAEERTRTSTRLPGLAPEASASANSATPARRGCHQGQKFSV